MFEYVMRHQMDCCTSFLLAPTCLSRMNLQDYSIIHIILFFHYVSFLSWSWAHILLLIKFLVHYFLFVLICFNRMNM